MPKPRVPLRPQPPQHGTRVRPGGPGMHLRFRVSEFSPRWSSADWGAADPRGSHRSLSRSRRELACPATALQQGAPALRGEAAPSHQRAVADHAGGHRARSPPGIPPSRTQEAEKEGRSGDWELNPNPRPMAPHTPLQNLAGAAGKENARLFPSGVAGGWLCPLRPPPTLTLTPQRSCGGSAPTRGMRGGGQAGTSQGCWIHA